MEAPAVDKLVEKGRFPPDVALAIAEAVDITIKGGDFVTVPILDARFAAFDAKMAARFASIEKSISSTKVWAVYLYATLVIALFSALAADHHWLETRQDEFYARLDHRFDEAQRRSDEKFHEEQRRSDEKLQEIQRQFDEMQRRSDEKFEAMHSGWQQPAKSSRPR